MSYKILFIAIRINSFFILLLDLTCQSKGLLNNILSGQLSSTILLIFMNAFIISFFVSIELLLQKIFSFRIISDLLDIFEQIMNVLSLGKLFEDTFLICFKNFLLIFNHLSILIIMITKNIVNFLDSKCSINSFYIFKLVCDKVMLI